MFTNMQEVEMEVPDVSNEVEIKQEPAEWLLQPNTPVVPLWAMGTLKCNKCEFRTKYESVLRDHREVKHISGFPSQPDVQQQNTSNIPKWAMGELKCGPCGLTTKYQTILDYHQQKEKHVMLKTSLPWDFQGSYMKKAYRNSLNKQRESEQLYQTKFNRFKGESCSTIIMKAIQSSNKNMARLQEIYSYFEKHFPSKDEERKASTENHI